jgi:hypothetical protein
MSEGEEILAALEREAARQNQLTKLFGCLVLAAIALLSAKVIDLI